MKYVSQATVIVVIFLLSLTPAIADSVDQLGTRLLQLRSDVENLNNELVLMREEHKQRMKQMYAQAAELESSVETQQRRSDKLRKSLKLNQQTLKKYDVGADRLKPVIVDGLDRLDAYMLKTIPFKLQERRAAVQSLRQDLGDSVVPAQKVAVGLWALIEDEIRMSRENGVFRQPVYLNGETVLADVARLGSSMLFFKTSDERWGYASRANNQWQYTLSEENQQQIAALFDALGKQIRTGYFQLPNVLAKP